MRLKKLWISGVCAACLGFGQRVGVPTDDLLKLSVDELFGIQVTSVGRKAQRMSKAPAAVFVLTSEDIRRSGATSIPEALRAVPGLTVLRIDGRSWVVSARGGARVYADKMLVMIDGRSLYNPLFSGLIWDTVDVSLEDVERIEIVRGPGAVMWGPNAMNGVINVITKRTQATKGVMTSVSVGNEQRAAVETRVGSAVNDRVAYRIWGKAAYDTPAFDSTGYYNIAGKFIVPVPAIRNLDFSTIRLGFRIDGQKGEHDSWTVEGDGFKNNRQDPIGRGVLLPSVFSRYQDHTDYEGGFIQGQWTHTGSDGGESVFKASYDLTRVDYPFARGSLNNLVLDWQKRMPVSERHELYVGGGYQQYWDLMRGQYFVIFDPAATIFRDGDIVVRDEWQIVGQRLMASMGVRLDYNSYGRVEYQPSVRLLYTPNARRSLWLATSRAIRTPSRYDRDLQADAGSLETPIGLPLRLTFHGTKDMLPEIERGLEAGYRQQAGQRWSFDVSTYWNYYSRLRALRGSQLPELVWTGQALMLETRLEEGNFAAGRSYGGEVWGYFQVTPTWRLTPSYSYLNEVRWRPPSTVYSYDWDSMLGTIGHQGLLRSQHELTRTLQLDLSMTARSRNRTFDLPGTVLLEARLGWRPARLGEISMTVQNLGDRRVLESYSEGLTPAIPLRRLFTVKWTRKF